MSSHFSVFLCSWSPNMAKRWLSQAAKLLFGGAVLTATVSAGHRGALSTHVFADSLAPVLQQAFTAPITPWKSNWDRREAAKPNSTATRHILLVRHGQYQYAEDDLDCHLTPLGREQTDLTGQRLAQLNYPYARIVYSTMTRAIESTDEIIKHLPGVPAVPCDFVREGAPFPPEPEVPGWPPEGKKAFEVDGRRIESAFQHYIHRADTTQTEDSYEIVVCHGNVIRYFVCRALQLPPEAWIRISLDHGSLTWLTIQPSGNVSLRWLGNSGYMPRDKLTVQ